MLQLWFFTNTVLWPIMTKVGGISLSLSVVVLMLAGVVWLGKSAKITVGSAKALLAFLAYVIFSSVVAFTGPCSDHLQKSMLTMPILLFLVLIGLEVGHRASDRDWSNLQKTAQWTLLAAFSAFILETVMPAWFPDQEGYRIEGKLSGVFQEPSHVAFSLFPCIAVLLVAEDKRTRQKGMLALLAILIFSRSSTLVALVAAWIIYRLLVQRKGRQTVMFALAAAALVVLGTAIDYERFVLPTIERIAGITAPSEVENISSLIYVQGWQDAWANLRRTHGLGLGLNMMGCGTLPDVSARAVLALEGHPSLNSEDGSFLFAKVVSEAGAGGIAFYIAVIWWWARLERKLRLHSKDATRFAAEVQAALLFCFVASSFIRSASYFGGGLLLWVVTISGASRSSQSLSNQPAEAHVSTSPAGTPVKPNLKNLAEATRESNINLS